MSKETELDYAGERIGFIGSRISDSIKAPTHGHGHGHGHGNSQDQDHEDQAGLVHRPSYLDVPVFTKSHAASHFELFYDLWFVANLNVFASVHDITNPATLRSFVGFITLLWTTWLMTTIYDVRFTSDSILERCCRAVHLGVMTGFAEIGTSFNPDKQIMSVYRAMSIFLAVSRFVLALQYGLSAWQVRKFVHGRRPLLATAGFHLLAAIAYIVISTRYEVGKNSRSYIAWYIIGLAEMALHLLSSQFSPVLTFLGSHFGERLNLLTLIVMGEGVIILAKNITLVVKDTYLKDASLTVWSPSLIGIVTSSTALIYIIFQLYFDWMHGEDESMSKRHQVWWAGLHLPFHIALVLLVEGTNQFIIWWRISESIDIASHKLLDLDKVEPTSDAVVKELTKRVYYWLEKYPPPNILDAYQGVNTTLAHIKELPNSFWNSTDIPDTDPSSIQWSKDVSELYLTMVSGIFNNFGVEAPETEEKKSSDNVTGHDSHDVIDQSAMLDAISKRFRLVFIYAFLCAGIVLLFLTIMHIISKRRGWSPFNIFRTGVCIALSIGLSLITIVATNEDAVDNFMGSPWMLPTITLSYFTALVLTHLPHPRRFGLGHFRRGAYKEVEGQRQHGIGMDDVPLKHVPAKVIVTPPGRDDDPHEGRRGVFTSAELHMPPSPDYDAAFDAHDPLRSPPPGHS
ncbi:bacterial low temperature requirement A protein-domain-containing protein [Apiospora arundinis]|uniref:Bacterial low temperature requirement A protein-domain-containing protein n=1 Tax=Apiospora arundinis TaxID=335852 RepID=A0ABR2J8A9_9PEZI